jgi:hypothetical protein
VGPDTVHCQERFVASVPLTNTGWRTWDSGEPQPTCASYHWRDKSGRTVVHDGARTPFAAPVRHGDSGTVQLGIVAPEAPGAYQLEIDIVREGVTWFSEQGCRPSSIAIHVVAAPAS